MDVKWSPKSLRAMAEIWDYYGPKSPRAVTKILSQIEAAALRAGRMPLAYPVELILEERPEGFRSMVVGHIYKIVYFIEDDNVNIATVWDCRRDPEALKESV